MSWSRGSEPVGGEIDHAQIEQIIEGRSRDIGAFAVRRVLPAVSRRMVGPFIFFDHMGPADIPPGRGMDVRPHPHIDLATVTYLFEGEIVHRDSLGMHQAITPGAINWMTAGRGIVHSERTAANLRESGTRVHGIQLWVALPTEYQDIEPSFVHYPAVAIPALERDGVKLRVLCGSAFGVQSPVKTHSTLFYVDAIVPRDATLTIADDYPERAAYVVSGSLRCGEEQFVEGQMLVFSAGCSAHLKAHDDARVMLLGGQPVDGPRHIFWNFVSSDEQRIERAKADWAKGPGNTDRFPKVPGDEDEFIPLPQ